MRSKVLAKTLLSPAAALVLLLLFYFLKDMYPFGSATLAWVDMKQQVIPLMLQWKEIISDDQSMFLNMLNSGGSSFWGIFFFFVSSPFSLLILLIDKHESVLFMNILVAVKISAAALTSSIMFRKLYTRLSELHIFILSILYSFCGFSLMFFQNLIWLDFVILFPLLLLGLTNLFERGHIGLYFFVLTLMLLTSYYLSYMIAIFLLLYALFNLMSSPGKNRTASKIAVVSLTSVGLTSFVWLPSLYEYFISARSSGLFDSLLSGGFSTYYETTTGVILSTSVLIVVFPLFVYGSIENGYPYGKLLRLFLLTLVPVFIEPINKMWHTGSYQAFPARFGYIPVLLGLSIIAYYLQEKRDEKNTDKAHNSKSVYIAVIISLLVVTAVVVFVRYMTVNRISEMSRYARTLWGDQQSFILLFFSFLFIGAVYYFLIVVKSSGVLPKIIYGFLIVVLMISEIYMNLEVYVGTPANSAENYKNIFDLEDRIDDKSFYRVKSKLKYFDVNMTGALGYNSLASYTSLTPQKYLFAMKNLGYSSYWMEVNSSHSTAFTDALFVNRYEISEYDGSTVPTGNLVYSNDKYRISEKLSLKYPAFLLDADSLDLLETIGIRERLEYQNHVFRVLSGTDKTLFVRYPHTSLVNVDYDDSGKHYISKTDEGSADITYEIFADGRQTLYFDCFDQVSARLTEHINESINIYVDNILKYSKFPEKNSNGILELGEFENESVTIRVEIIKNFDAMSFGLFGMDNELLRNTIEDLNTINTDLITSLEHSENSIMIGLNKDIQKPYPGQTTYLAVMIPDNGNIKVYTDKGRLLDTKHFMDAFVAIQIPEDTTGIKLVSVPKGFKTGIIVTIIVLVFAVIFVFIDRRSRKNGTSFFERYICDRAEMITKCVVIGFGVIVFIAVYLLPVFVHILAVFRV